MNPATPKPKLSELRLITKSLMFLALLTGILYLRVFIIAPIIRSNGWSSQPALPIIFLLVAMLGLISTWRWEGAGSLIAIIGGCGLSILMYIAPEQKSWLISFFYGSPFIISGVLSLICWRRERTAR